MLQLLNTLNHALQDKALPDAHIEEVFEVWWPKLEAELSKLPADRPTQRPHRTEREVLEELVDTVRSTSQEDARLLKFAADEIASISARLTTLEAGAFSSLRQAISPGARDVFWSQRDDVQVDLRNFPSHLDVRGEGGATRSQNAARNRLADQVQSERDAAQAAATEKTSKTETKKAK